MKIPCLILMGVALALPPTLRATGLAAAQFSASGSIITFETGSTGLPSVPGVSFSGGDATFSTDGFGKQIFGNLNGSTYLDVYFSQPQQAVGAYIVNDEPGGGVTGVIEVAYDQSNNIIETVSTNFPPLGYPPNFLGIGEPTAQIYRAEWQYIGGGYFGVDNVTYGTAIGLSQMPNIPTGLSATPHAQQIFLAWSPSYQAATYNVKRANSLSGPYVTVGSGVGSTNYTDPTVTNGYTYYYVVTGVNTYGESSASRPVAVYSVDHFAFAAVPSPQTSSVPLTVTISACDSSNVVITNFTGAGTLSSVGDHGVDPVTPTATGAFSNGTWTGAVTVVSAYPDTNLRLTCSSNGVAGTSSPFNVVAPANQLFNLDAADLVYNPFLQLIYATIPSSAAAYSNCLVTIDPVFGRIVNSYYLGNNPTRMAISDDGQFLYLGFTGTNGFGRFNIASNEIDLMASAGVDSTYGEPQYARELAVLPGNPHSVAIAENTGYAENGEIIIYDDGVRRTNILDGLASSSDTVAAASATRLYGGSPFTQFTVDATGVISNASHSGLGGSDQVYQNGLMFTAQGQVFNPETFAVVTNLPTAVAVAPDLAAGVIFTVAGQSSSWALYSFNSTNFQAITNIPLPGISGTPVRLIRWGTQGLALSTSGNQVFLLRTPIVPPAVPVLRGGVLQGPGSFQLKFMGDQSVPYVVFASTNLVNWVQLGAATSIGGGLFQFVDSSAGSLPFRYYKAAVAP